MVLPIKDEGIEDFPPIFIDGPIGPFPGAGTFDITSRDATETAEPENAGVRIRRKAFFIDSSMKLTTGALRRALLSSVSLHDWGNPYLEILPETKFLSY